MNSGSIGWSIFAVWLYLMYFARYLIFIIPILLIWFYVKNRPIKISLITVLFGLLLYAVVPTFFPLYEVRGRVTDAVTGEPVRYAVITYSSNILPGKNTTNRYYTNENGEYSVGTKKTHGTITFLHPRYESYNIYVQYGRVQFQNTWLQYTGRVINQDIKLQKYFDKYKDIKDPMEWCKATGSIGSLQPYLLQSVLVGIEDKVSYVGLGEEWKQIFDAMPSGGCDKSDSISTAQRYEALISSGTMLKYALERQAPDFKYSSYTEPEKNKLKLKLDALNKTSAR